MEIAKLEFFHLNDTNNLNNDIFIEYNLKEIVIHEGIADTVIIIF